MNNSINVNGLSFRLQDNGGLLIPTPTGQYQVQPQGVADLFDLLSAGQGNDRADDGWSGATGR